MSTGPITMRRSPDRHTFQLDNHIKRLRELGDTAENQATAAALTELYHSFRARDEHNAADPAWRRNNLEWDLRTSNLMCARVLHDQYAKKLYAALCNTDWLRTEVIPLLRQDPNRDLWHCSWRSAGGIVANMREQGDYMDWYCAGQEGHIDPQISADLKALGWQGIDSEGTWA